MAVPEQTPYIEHTGNGVTTSFSLGFQCESKDHLIVLVDEIEPPIATWSLTGGNVVFTTAPAAGKKITAQRNTPFSRNVDYQSYNNSFRPPAVNKDFDWIWWKLQELGVADWILSNRINDLRAYVDKQDNVLQDNIDSLKNYVDDKDDELRNYLLNAIQEQGVALDQLEEYYSYLMQQLAQVAIDRGWAASFIVSADGSTQQEINDFGGAKWRNKPLGYDIGSTVKLENGDIVKSISTANTNNPNTITTGWIKEVHTTNLRQFFIKGDGSDETAKLQGAIDFCLANGVDVIDSENLRIKTTGTIIINKAIKIINNLQIDCHHDQIGLLCRPTAANFKTDDVQGEVLNLDVSVFRHKYYDVPTAVGIQLWNCYTGVIRYNSANRHYDALQLRADRNSGTSYCTLYLGNIKSCSGGVLIKENYADGGWVTQNTFYDGNFGGGGDIRPYMRYHIMLDGTSFSHNSNNVFFRPSLEGWMTHGVIARNTANNTILYPYIEMPNATYYWDIESTSQSFQITGGNGVAGPLVGGKWRDFGSYTRIQTTGFSGQGALDYMNGTFYEYVDKFRPAREQVKPTASRGRVSVGFKTHKSITHSVAGGLTIDLAEADAFAITVRADLTSITFTNMDLVQPLEEKTITFIQEVADLVITPFSATIRGSFSNPLSRNNAQHIYTLQRMRHTVALGVVDCATNVDVNGAVTHSTAGALTLNFNLGDMITVTANADITSMSLQQANSLKVGGTRTVVFVQNSTGVTINAFSPTQLGQGKANPVPRPNGVDVYTLMRMESGAIVCTGVYSS
ncbi:hypothetical protein [Acinetobacter sp. USHLN143]|uniref:hypothetical protein n=1 Tax=Acinetobacter sp. USHLN143 TaxID=3081679 RepID=UPI0030176483